MRQPSLARYLDMLKPGIPGKLISDACFSRIRRLADRIPGALAFSTFGFECPLGVEEAEADFLFSLFADNSGPQILSGQLPEHDFDGDLLSLPQWQQVRSFGACWADPPSPLHKGMDDVWLEFDVSRIGSEAEVLPSLFFSPFYRHPYQDLRQWDAGSPIRLLTDLISRVQGRQPAGPSVLNWGRCLEMLPSPKHLFQVGIMLARSAGDALRMCLIARNAETLKRYLHDLRWPGDVSQLEPTLKYLSGIFNALYLHVDVGAHTSPKIGIECKFPHRREPAREPRWFDFLDYLDRRGLCLLSKQQGLLAFPGFQRTDADACPEPLGRLAKDLFPLYSSFFVRTLFHTKLVFREDQTWEAKAYLGIHHLWRGAAGDHQNGNGLWGIIG